MSRSVRLSRARRPAATVLLLVCASVCVVPAAAAVQTTAAACPWVTSTALVASKVAQVVSLMTLDEKIGMVDGSGFAKGTQGYVGTVAPIPRLCVPALRLEDGPQGVADAVPGVTQLPAPSALASSWDPALAQQYGGVVGAEQRGKGVDVDLGPTVNIVRDPRWGRAFESYGEDPYLSGQLAVGYIGGVQATGVLAQVKHWAVYNQETNRNTAQDDAIVAPRTMQEIYLPQFQAAVQRGGAASVMCSYSMINGQFGCENQYLLGVLKGAWGFSGFVTSDWGATHSTVASANAGLDLDMPGGHYATDYFGAPLKQAVQSGQVPMARLDDMVGRILTEMFRFDLFAHPPTGSLTTVVATAQHAALGRTVAERGTVLLKNSGALPLTAATRTVAVIGSDAGPDALTSGGGSAGVLASHVVTPVQGITARARQAGATVTYAQGDVPASGALPPVPAAVFGTGLRAAYYNNATMTGTPAATGTLADLNRTWSGSPAPGVDASGWSARITGTIAAPASGSYQLSLTLTGSAGVLVNGAQVITGTSGYSGTATTRATVTLPAGRPTIEVDYTPKAGPKTLQLGWVTPTTQAQLSSAAVAAAKASLVAVVFAGVPEGEGADLPNIDLPGDVNQVIAAVAAANPNTVVVLNTGSAVTMPWLGQVRGVLEAWYPGQDDGTAAAAVLYGDVDPSGRLPVTFPTSLAQTPTSSPAQFPGVNGTVQYSEGLLVGYRWYATKAVQPLFPFGYGLSYTSFRMADERVSRTAGGTTTVTVQVSDTGSRAGTEVVQAYVRDPASTGEPAEQLRGFASVALAAHQTKTVTLTLDSRAFQWWNPGTQQWVTTPGTYQVSVGDSSTSQPLSQQVTVS